MCGDDSDDFAFVVFFFSAARSVIVRVFVFIGVVVCVFEVRCCCVREEVDMCVVVLIVIVKLV